jgi:hypothetical protein
VVLGEDFSWLIRGPRRLRVNPRDGSVSLLN